MLKRLFIQNFLFVSALEARFDGGLIALTGESGVGKSVFLRAIKVLLGDRLEETYGREVVLEGEFMADSDIQLEGRHLRAGELLTLRRALSSKGALKSTLNGQTISAALLKELGARLLDIQSQHAHQALKRSDFGRDYLDGYTPLLSQRSAETRRAFELMQSLRQRLLSLKTQEVAREARLHQLKEDLLSLEGVPPTPEALKSLILEHDALTHAQDNQAALSASFGLLEGGEEVMGILSSLSELSRQISSLKGIRGKDDWKAEAEGALSSLSSLEREIARMMDQEGVDETRAQEVELLMGRLFELERRFRCPMVELLTLRESFLAEIQALEQSKLANEGLEEALSRAEAEYQRVAEGLSALRTQGAEEIERLILPLLSQLGLQKSALRILLPKEEGPTAHGHERVEFHLQHPGALGGPLAKIASGGELSRLSLALSVLSRDSRSMGQPHGWVFDEIDSGTGGHSGEAIGQVLKRLSSGSQVFTITHQASIAALASTHYQIFREGDEALRLSRLSGEAREIELARMLGGEAQSARMHARNMLERAQHRTQ